MENVYYLADRKNFPYGQLEKESLISILASLIKKILTSIDPKIIVLACNTASVSALEKLRQNFGQISFVGTVPAVKPAGKASRTGKIGILGTTRTIEDPYIQHIAQDLETNSGIHIEISGIAAPDLVEFVEQRFYSADKKEKKDAVKKYIDLFRAKGVDTLVLGCTHFLYLLDEFRKEASPFIKIFDSQDGVTKRIEFLLDENDGTLRANCNAVPRANCNAVSRANSDAANGFGPDYRLLLTGTEPIEISWQKRAQDLNFELKLI